MSEHYQAWKPRSRKEKRDTDIFQSLISYMPKSVMELIRQKAEEIGMPMSRLVAIAVDNELDQSEPFTYPCPMPAEPYTEFTHVQEATKLFKFMQRLPEGTTLESLMLCRRDIGLETRADLMLAYRELLEKGMIETFKPSLRNLRYKGDRAIRVRITKDVATEIKRAGSNMFSKSEGIKQYRHKRYDGETK